MVTGSPSAYRGPSPGHLAHSCLPGILSGITQSPDPLLAMTLIHVNEWGSGQASLAMLSIWGGPPGLESPGSSKEARRGFAGGFGHLPQAFLRCSGLVGGGGFWNIPLSPSLLQSSSSLPPPSSPSPFVPSPTAHSPLSQGSSLDFPLSQAHPYSFPHTEGTSPLTRWWPSCARACRRESETLG